MSNIDNITGELRAMTTGIDKAHADAAAVDNRAQEVAAQAAASGFVAIAQGMSQVRAAIGEIRGSLTAVAGSINEAATPVAAAPKEMSPQQAIAVLSPAAEKVVAARDGISATINKVDETQRLAAMVLHGGQPGPILSMLAGIKQVLMMVGQRGGTAQQHLDSAVSAARRIGESGN